MFVFLGHSGVVGDLDSGSYNYNGSARSSFTNNGSTYTSSCTNDGSIHHNFNQKKGKLSTQVFGQKQVLNIFLFNKSWYLVFKSHSLGIVPRNGIKEMFPGKVKRYSV